jgi:DUF971 family protein
MASELRSIKRVGEAIAFCWADGVEAQLAAHALRKACPCALCINEVTGEPLLDPSTVSSEIQLLDMQPVGHYAYRLLFSDQHDSGIYRLEQLHRLCSP